MQCRILPKVILPQVRYKLPWISEHTLSQEVCNTNNYILVSECFKPKAQVLSRLISIKVRYQNLSSLTITPDIVCYSIFNYFFFKGTTKSLKCL